MNTAEDREYREYDNLITDIVEVGSDVNAFLFITKRVTRFVTKPHNPVYGERLLRVMDQQGYYLMGALLNMDEPHYATMRNRDIVRAVLSTHLAVQGTIEHNDQMG